MYKLIQCTIEAIKSHLTLKRYNLYANLRYSTGVDKPEINTDKPKTNNPNSAELPKQPPRRLTINIYQSVKM